MTDNPSVLTTPNEQALHILVVLGDADPTLANPLVQRVQKFIECNGYEGVLRAARGACKVMERRPPGSVHAYNTNLARLSHLYVLTHLVENALRSQVDIGGGRAWGTT